MNDLQDRVPTRESLRRFLKSLLRIDDHIDEFCGDHFQEVAREFSEGMTQSKKFSLLLNLHRGDDILRALQKARPEAYKEHVASLKWEAPTKGGKKGRQSATEQSNRPLLPLALAGGASVNDLAEGANCLPSQPIISLRLPTTMFDFSVTATGELSWPLGWTPELFVHAWGDVGMTDPTPLHVTANFQFFAFSELARALLRFAFHGGISILAVPDPSVWLGQATDVIGNCIGILDESWKPTISRSTHSARWGIVESNSTDSGPAMVESVSAALEACMDQWVLRALNLALNEVFDASFDRLGVRICDEFLKPMKAVWQRWRATLEADANLRHAFLSGMLGTTGPASQPTAQRKAQRARLGPRTLAPCLLPATIFALAIEVAVNVDMAPSADSLPSNLSMESQYGHLVGLERVDLQSSGGVREINSCFKSLKWGSGYVLLARAHESMLTVNVIDPRIGAGDNTRRRFFQQGHTSITVLTRDSEFVRCLDDGVRALKDYLVATIGEPAIKETLAIELAINGRQQRAAR